MVDDAPVVAVCHVCGRCRPGRCRTNMSGYHVCRELECRRMFTRWQQARRLAKEQRRRPSA